MTSPPTAPPTAPIRVLGLFDSTCIVIGAIIGVGIFFSPGKVAALCQTPSLALTAWILAGFLALCGGLAFAELGRRCNSAGAQYTILHQSLGAFPAFLFVFCNATAIQAGSIGVIATICARNLLVAAGWSPQQLALETPGQFFSLPLILAAALIAAVTLANIIGVKWGSRIQAVTVISKLAALLSIIGLAAWMRTQGTPVPASPSPLPGSLPGVQGVVAALVPAFFAYGGWQHALWIAGEIKDPRRTLPRAIITGVLIVVAVYVLANWAYLSLLGHAHVASSDTLAADAMKIGIGPIAQRIIAGAVAISAFGVLNAQLLSGPRLVYAMAEEGRFFRTFAALSPTHNTPARAIILLGAAGLLLLLLAGNNGAGRLLTGVVFLDGIFFALTAAALLLPSFIARTLDQPPLPFSRAAAAIFVIGELGVVTGAYLDPDTRQATWIGGLWILLAALLYLWKFRTPTPNPAPNSTPENGNTPA